MNWSAAHVDLDGLLGVVPEIDGHSAQVLKSDKAGLVFDIQRPRYAGGQVVPANAE